jgi:hypothetical protein
MISLPSGTHIWIAAGVTDLRRGFTGLSAVAQTVLEKEPYSGHAFVFRAGGAAIWSSCCGGMAMDSAVPPQKTHNIVFEPLEAHLRIARLE